MAASGGTTNAWINFFTDAGIPAGIAASYALTFSNNRIRMDMLLDLNKEYLKDMGITLMGDVISILRHAKHVHEQNAWEKILANSKNSSPQKSSHGTIVRDHNTSSRSSTSSSTATRMLDHYMRKTDPNSCDVDIESSTPKASTKDQQKSGVQSNSKTKKQVLKKPDDQLVSPPAKKVRRVLPEHEGRYKITMPSGSTPRSQKILAKQGLLNQKKKTVFDRLGDGSIVTSTTENDGPSITITGLGLDIVKPATSTSEKQTSVFSRLGEKSLVSSTSNQDVLESSTYLEEDDVPIALETGLPYAGVFKQEARKKIVKKVQMQKIKVPTMQADIESARQLITEDGRIVSKGVQVQKRLGTSLTDGMSLLQSVKTPNSIKIKKMIKTNKSTAGILANPTNARKLSVKARLGNSDSEASSSITSTPIFRRKKIILVKKSVEKVTPLASRAHDLSPHTSPVKSVTFGGVTKKTFVPREAITSSKNPMSLQSTVTSSIGLQRLSKGPGSITLKTGVFSRLGS